MELFEIGAITTKETGGIELTFGNTKALTDITELTVITSYSIHYTKLYDAFSHPVTAAVLAAMAPAISAVVAWAMLGIRPNRTVTLSLVLVAAGGVLATVDLSRVGAFRLRGGEILIVLASATWAWFV